MSEGYFVSRVFTSNAQLPIPEATVVISQGRELLATRTTDSSGVTAPVAIPTPEESQSLAPGLGKPYAEIDVVVNHPHFSRIVAKNVQIFPNVTTMQNFELVPDSSVPSCWDSTENFDTPPQNL